MKILLINGSPKGKRSNSLRLSNSFIEGYREEVEKNGEEVTVDEIEVASLNIAACKGCFACWQKTPGVCAIKDDMPMVIEKELEADVIVWSFPLYYFNVPGCLKNLIDRQLPMNLPFMSENTSGVGSGSHESRYERKPQKNILVSTCGFYSTKGNYDSVTGMFEHFIGKGNFETVFCSQGELFKIKELSQRTDEYLSYVKEAGKEYASGSISEETREKLDTLLYPKEVFEGMADASWGINKETKEKESDDLIFTRQMALLYNKKAYDGKDRVLEICYTDLGNTYQILLSKDGSKVFTDGSLSSTTRIDTPFDVWKSISAGEIGGAEALGKSMYKVSGDFSLMIDWDKFFGSVEVTKEKESKKEDEILKPSMGTMLIPWCTFWIAASINAKYGSLITLGILALVPFIMRKHKFIIWDQLSFIAVAVLSIIVSLTGNGDFTAVGYLVFGLFWLISCFTKEPLSAAYVKYNYGGDKALDNPLFMEPNYILSIMWGVLYLLTTGWTILLRRADLVAVVTVVNSLVPMLMGFFTAWFEKWYPAWRARGGFKKQSGVS